LLTEDWDIFNFSAVMEKLPFSTMLVKYRNCSMVIPILLWNILYAKFELDIKSMGWYSFITPGVSEWRLLFKN
jgi:hypothetical protein